MEQTSNGVKTSIQKLPKSKLEIKIEVSAEEFNDFYQKAILNLGKDLEMPGFRKGKVPKEIIEKAISPERIIKEAVELAVKESYIKAILENKIEALGQPEISDVSYIPVTKLGLVDEARARGQGLEFKARVSIMPEVKLPDYKEIASKVQRKKIEVSGKEVEDALKWLQKSRAKFTLKNSPCQKGDWVEIEYSRERASAEVRPQQAKDETYKDAFILGEGHFASGFEDNLIGMSAGQEKEFSLPAKPGPVNEKPLRDGFPADLREAIPEVLQIKVKMKSVQKMELPEINDEFTKGLGNFQNLNALKQSIEVGIRQEKEIQETRRIRQEILEKISQKTEMEIPEILIEEQKKRYLENLKREVGQNLQIGFEEYLKKINKTEPELLSSFQEQAQNQVETSLVLREIQKKENIKVGEEEVSQEVNKFLKNYPNPEEAQKKFDLEQLKSYTEEVVKQEKVFAKLESFAKTKF